MSLRECERVMFKERWQAIKGLVSGILLYYVNLYNTNNTSNGIKNSATGLLCTVTSVLSSPAISLPVTNILNIFIFLLRRQSSLTHFAHSHQPFVCTVNIPEKNGGEPVHKFIITDKNFFSKPNLNYLSLRPKS